MPTPFQSIVDFVDNSLTQSPSARTPLINYHDVRISKIIAQFGERTIDSSNAVEKAVADALREQSQPFTGSIDDNLLNAMIQSTGELGAQLESIDIDAWSDSVSEWANASFGNDWKVARQFYEERIDPRIQASREWIIQDKINSDNLVIEAVEWLQAGYNEAMEKIDSLALNAGDMSGSMSRVVDGLGQGLMQIARSGLQHLGLEKADDHLQSLQNLRNDTRTLRISQIMNILESAIASPIPSQPIPSGIPGATVSNWLISAAQKAITSSQIAAQRFIAAHTQKLEDQLSNQTINIVINAHPSPEDSPEGRPSQMPRMSPERMDHLRKMALQAVSDIIRHPGSVEQALLEAVEFKRLEVRKEPVQQSRSR